MLKQLWFKRVVTDCRWQEVEKLIDECQALVHEDDKEREEQCHARLRELGQLLRQETTQS